MHFIADVWGYWAMFPERARSIAISVGVLIVFTVGAGFLIVGTPQQARLARTDVQRIQDLQEIQARVIYIWQQKGKLPKELADLNDSLSNFVVPTDPQTGTAYEYAPMGVYSFALCGNFATTGTSNGALRPKDDLKTISNDNWLHGPGRQCFVRIIDPKLYPIVSNNSPATVPVVKR